VASSYSSEPDPEGVNVDIARFVAGGAGRGESGGMKGRVRRVWSLVFANEGIKGWRRRRRSGGGAEAGAGAGVGVGPPPAAAAS